MTMLSRAGKRVQRMVLAGKRMQQMFWFNLIVLVKEVEQNFLNQTQRVENAS